jgi:hypothetical protein
MFSQSINFISGGNCFQRVPNVIVKEKSNSLRVLFFICICLIRSKLQSSNYKQKSQVFQLGFFSSVLRAGLEPAQPNGHRILSPACLPIPPPEHLPIYIGTHRCFDRCQNVVVWLLYLKKLERKTGFEPATSTLARSRSTN